jgi:RNA polymerase sigma factor (sigma-70 family)
MNDLDIIKGLKSGNEALLETLYKKHYKMMVNMIIKNSGTEEEAKDIYQDSIIVFWQKVHSENFELTSKISTYLYSICLNLWRKELERKKRFSHEEKDGESIQAFEQNERVKIMNECLQLMGDVCRKVLSLYYFDNYSMQEIANELGFANADTAKTKKYKCKKDLDQLVKSKYKESDIFD